MSVDIFTIWTLVLTGIGFSCITKVKRGTCMGVVFGWWVVVVLVGAGHCGAVLLRAMGGASIARSEHAGLPRA